MFACVCVPASGVTVDDIPVQVAFAGDHVNMTLAGIDMANVNIGNILFCFFNKFTNLSNNTMKINEIKACPMKLPFSLSNYEILLGKKKLNDPPNQKNESLTFCLFKIVL